MSKFLDMHRTIDEWKELVRNMQSTTDSIVYNCLVAISNGDFDHINRCEMASKLNVNIYYIDYIIECYAEFENNPYESFQDYYEKIYGVEI